MKKAIYLILFALPLFIACRKRNTNSPSNSNNNNPNNSNNVIINTYNANLSAVNKNYDSASVDVDNDNIKDFTIMAYNSTFDSYQQSYRTIKASIIYSWKDSTMIALTDKYANNGWARLYNFGSSSQYFYYTNGFNSGSSIDASIPSNISYTSSSGLIAFEVGHIWNYTSTYIYESNGSSFYYDESIGDFVNSTQYIGFSMRKTDGRHYGWIKISNSNSCLNVSIISSGFSSNPNQSITTN